MAGQDGGYALGVDLGTSNTVAVIRWPDGRTRPLLFDGHPILPSAVFLDHDGRLHVGRDAQRLAQADPARYEPNPKRRVDEPGVLLGDREIPTADLLAAVLGAVARAAVEAVGFLPPAILTYPAAWGARRRDLLSGALARAGWPPVGDNGTRLVAEPVAAARYFADVLRRPVPVGASLAVFDFGGGTLDVAVVRNEGVDAGRAMPAHAPPPRPVFAVIGSGGVAELGGLDLDAALVDHLGRLLRGPHQQAWQALAQPSTTAQWRNRWQFWDDVRGAKEMLSRTAAAPVPVPGVDQAVHLTREELERLVTPLLRRGVMETASVIGNCGLRPDQLAGLFLVGGSSRVPLVARMLHADLGIAPTVLEQPELPVAEGALAGLATRTPVRAAVSVPSGRGSGAGGNSGRGSGAGGNSAIAPTSPGVPTPISPAPTSVVPEISVSPASPATAPPVQSPAQPPRRRTALWIAAAVVALAGVVAAATLYLTSGGYDELDFQTIAEVGRVGAVNEEPYYVFTEFVGDRAYLAYERDDRRLDITAVDPAAPKDRELWRKQTSSGSDRWAGITALPNAVVALQEKSSDSVTRDMLVFDPDNGDERWHKLIDGDDTVLFGKDVLVLVDRAGNELLGLDLDTGDVMWKLPTPKDESGYTTTAVYPALTVQDVSGPTDVSGSPFAPRRDDDQRIVQINADRSARVIDAASGKVLKTRQNVADPDDDTVVAYNGRLLVATDEAGYRVSAYDLDRMGEPVNIYTAPDEQHDLDLLAMCGEHRACLLDSVDSDDETTHVVAIDMEKGGELWRKPAPGAEILVHFGDQVAARNLSSDYRTRIFDVDGREVLNREGAAGRVDAGNLLLFDSVSSAIDDYSVAGLHAGSDQPIEMGQLKDVRMSSCSWNSTYIVCAARTDFVISRFAR